MSIVGENLTFRIRKLIYEKLLRMEVGWHDLPENNPGALSTMLSSDS